MASPVDRKGDVLRAHVAALMLETHPSLYARAGEARIAETLTALGFTLAWHRLDVWVWRHQ